MADLAKKYFSSNDITAITQAVTEAEKLTSAEILVRVVSRSHSWTRERLVLACDAVVVVLVAFLLIVSPRHWITNEEGMLALLLGAGAFLLVYFAAHPFLLRSRKRAEKLVRKRAMQELSLMPKTENETGVLLFLSLEERCAVVLAEPIVYGIVHKEFWSEVIACLTAGMSKGDHAESVSVAIKQIGEHLKKPFPRERNDINELPDTPRID